MIHLFLLWFSYIIFLLIFKNRKSLKDIFTPAPRLCLKHAEVYKDVYLLDEEHCMFCNNVITYNHWKEGRAGYVRRKKK